MILEKIDKLLNESLSKKDILKFRQVITNLPKKHFSFQIKSFSDSYTPDERIIDYYPTKDGFSFEYNLDFEPDITEVLNEIIQRIYGVVGRITTERPTNTAIYTVNIKGKGK